MLVNNIKEKDNNLNDINEEVLDKFVATYMPNNEKISTKINLNGSNENKLVFNGKYKNREFTVVLKPSLIYDFSLEISSDIIYSSNDYSVIYILNEYEKVLRVSEMKRKDD